MDFLDPVKQKAHARRLALGYTLIGLVLVLATTVLLYRAYGFGIDDKGRVIQNGLVFVSTHPEGGDVYINKQKYKDRSNTRIPLPAGQYTMEITRSGYNVWKRAVTVEGGIVQRFDYPLLYPTNPTTGLTKQYEAAPAVTANSPDRRWLLIGTLSNEFELYDLDVKKPISHSLPLGDIVAAGSTTKAWEVIDWATDNRHVLLRRSYDRNGVPGTEYILLDREDPTLSQNLSVLFGFSPTSLAFNGKAHDKFYAFDQNSGQVFTIEVKKPTPQPYLDKVLAFAADGETVTYVTDKDAPTGKVLVRLRHKADASYTLRQLPIDPTYLLNFASYEGKSFVAAGASADNKVYIYRDPLSALQDDPKEVPAPIHILKVTAPSYVSFSPNKRMIMAESGDKFAVYDAENDRGYAYQIPTPLDAPQVHARWMDSFRMTTVSEGRVVAFEFDGANLRRLAAASPLLAPAFDHDYRYLYTVNTTHALTNTTLLTVEDL